jgi:RNA polymerase sigma-70 factor (ECF subfamily)
MNKLKKQFGRIYDKYIEKIYRFIFLKIGSEEIAQDLTSDTFLRGWKAFQRTQDPKNNYQIENTQAFLYQIARNLIADHYKEKGKVKIVSIEDRAITDLSVDLEKKAILSSDMNTIRLALNNLNEDYQNVIIWRYLDGFSTAEVAQIMNKSEQATRVLLHRALKSLKDQVSRLA